MKKLFASLFMLLVATSAFAQYNFPDTPTANQIVTGPAGQGLKWDGTKWVAQFGPAGGPFLLLTGGTLTGPGNLAVSGTLTQTGAASFASTVTFPSGSTATTAGFNNVKAIGIGAAAPTTAGALLQGISTGNYGTYIDITNKSNGTGAVAQLTLHNDSTATGDGAWLAFSSTGYNAQGPAIPADSFQMAANGTGGIVLATNYNISPGPPISFWVGPAQAAIMFGGQPAGNAGIQLNGSGALLWQSTTHPYAWINSPAMGTLNIAAGAHVNNAGTSWVADDTSASIVNFNHNQVVLLNNTGLTVGNNYGPTITAVFENNDATGASTALVFPNTNYSQIQFGTYQQPTASILGYGSGGSLHLSAGAWWNGSSWVASSTSAEDLLPQAGLIYMDIQGGLTIGGAISWGSASNMGVFENTTVVQGLDLPGFANRYGPGGSANLAGLTIGNSYFVANNWATIGMSGATYINAAGTWISDCGAGSGVGLFYQSVGHFYMYNHAGVGCGVAITWGSIASWSVTGMAVNHIENLDDSVQPTAGAKAVSTSVPSVSSGALVKGSRDMFGWIRDVTGGQTTLTFSENFDGESNCTLTDAGQPNLWFNANQTTGQVTFACVVPWTGEPCPDGAWVEYHCFGQGG